MLNVYSLCKCEKYAFSIYSFLIIFLSRASDLINYNHKAMNTKKFELYNNMIGWLVFAVSAFTYLSTIEPTASLWDCGEFISGSYKMEVVHPPGAPFFLMFMHIFTIFAPNAQSIPVIVNSVSAIASAFAVLFLFWTITMLARKFIRFENDNLPLSKSISILAAAVIGSLAFNFSDTVWFSAVEGEVYSMSLFFTALVFWLLMKWERRADEPHNLKWLILIFYMMGISIGVHLLSLLVLPVTAFVYYFKKSEKVTPKGVILAFAIGFIILGIVNVSVIRWFPAIASKVELLFVNSFRLPFWSGVLFTILITLGLIGYLIWYSVKKNKLFLNVALVGFLTIFIGYSSYTMVAIRSMSDPPIDYSDPQNVFSFISYINREQYGDRPLLYGPQFTTEMTDNKSGSTIYLQDKVNKKYITGGNKIEPVYDKEHQMFFPRMSDRRGDREKPYRWWSGMSSTQKYPSFAQNMQFFFKYQIGFMYWRYFAWNFIGRQNDEQGNGNIIPAGFLYGNWISGIPFIDKKLVGNTDKLPFELRTNKGWNKLYFLPFFFGLLGFFYHYSKNKRDFFSTLMLFFITGILLIVYQNSPPFEPRERDYTLVGSFWAFAIWIGMGVLALVEIISNRLKKDHFLIPVVVFIAALFAVPVLMANQEWDDHDRSHKWSTKDDALNYLNSCAPNAILFTNGDNDTYPLWYAQEVEGLRSDVRVVNLQLLMTDWNVEQLRKKVNESGPVKFSISQDKIAGEYRELTSYYDNPAIGIDPNKYYNIQDFINFVTSDDSRTKIQVSGGFMVNYYPLRKLYIPVDKEKVLRNGTVRKELASRIEDSVKFAVTRNTLFKNSLMVMDIIASNNWDRPIYFTITAGDDTYLGLQDYLQQEGMTYRLVPVKRDAMEKSGGEPGRIDNVIMYNNIMNKFRWGNMTDPKAYVESDTRRHMNNYRNLFASLGKSLLVEGQKDKIIKLLDLCQAKIPEYQVPHKLNSVQLVELYFLAGDKKKAMILARHLNDIFIENLDFFLSLNRKFYKMSEDEIKRNYYGLTYLQTLAQRNGETDFYKKMTVEISAYDKKLGSR